MGYTLGEASKQTGKSKSTLSKAVKTGKISATKLEDGSFSIEPVELFRMFPRVNTATVEVERSRTPNETPENSVKIKLLELELQHTREKLEEAKVTISKLDNDKEYFKSQLSSRLLNAPAPPTTPKNWIQRLFRT
jgi:hypothetical protein